MGNGITSSIQTISSYDVSTVGDAPASWLLGGVKWGGAVGTGVNLTYSFGNASSVYDNGFYAGYEPDVGYGEMSVAQKGNAIAALTSYANVASIVVTQVSDTATSAGDIRWANTTLNPNAYAWAYFPDSSGVGGDIWNNPDIPTPFTNEEFYVLAHELGHALGLTHPHEEPGRLTPAAPSGRDAIKYTLMSYNDFVGDLNINDESAYYPTTLMMDDIRTVQALYGKNMAYGAGNTTYQWQADSMIFETIWDGGGIDTINAANQLSGVSIDLNPGTFSTIGKAFNNGQELVRDCLAIAYECDIENAVGSAFNDTLQGNALANQLTGGVGNDTLSGAAGNDTLNGGTGVDSMIGGDGSDTYYVDNIGDVVSETNAVLSTGGTDLVLSSLSAYTLGENVENGRITATAAANLTGNALNNILYAAAGNNVIDGGLGTDTVSYQYASAGVTVSLVSTVAQATGGSGSDTLKNIENLTGSNFADTLTGNASSNILNGGVGADTLIGGDGSDTYYVDNIGDVVSETNAVASTGGTDLVLSALSAYTLSANVENGRINTTAVANLTGNALNNILYAAAGNNVLDGGLGSDTASYQYATAGVMVSLASTVAQTTGSSGSDTLLNIENLTGSNFADTLTGNASSNILNGGIGADTLNGGAGNDVLTGGLGADQLTGGTGADRFDFNLLTETGLTSTTWDTITDFKTSEGDKIDLQGVDANTALAGDQAFTFIGMVSTFTGDATGQLRFDAATHILYGSTDADTAAEFAIVLTGVSSLAGTDLVL